MSRWPSLDDYSEALYEPEIAFKDGSKLRNAVFMEQNISHIYSSGTFAGIARAKIDGQSWAVRLLLRNQDAVEKRYAAISKLRKNQRRYLLDTEYLPKEIFVQNLNNHFPVILIKWVDGENLSEYLFQACKNSDTEAIGNTAEMVREMRSYMRQHEIAHGDLSPENIMVTGKGKDRKLVLVDYDSMYLPVIADLPCDVGRGKLQHPKRPEKPLSIGKWADEMAYMIYDAGLSALSKHPELGVDPGLFEQKFLVSVDELLLRASPIIEKLDLDDLNLFEKAANYAEGEYGAGTENLSPVPTAEIAKPRQSRPTSDDSTKVRLYELARLLNIKPQELLELAGKSGLPGKSNLSILSEHEVQILKTAHKADIQLIPPARSLISIAEEFSLPLDVVVQTATDKLKLPVLTRTKGRNKEFVLSFDDYVKVRRELNEDSNQRLFHNQFTYTFRPGMLGMNLAEAMKIIESEEFTKLLNAPRNEHVTSTNGNVQLTQHGLNTLKGIYESLNSTETQRPALHPIATESLGISRGDALIIINLDQFAETLNAPREEHVLVSGGEIKLSQHGLNTLIEINNLVGKNSSKLDSKPQETKPEANTSETTPTPAPDLVDTVSAIAARHGLSNKHIFDIMRAENIYEFQKNKHHIVEKIANEDSRIFIHSEQSAANKTNIPRPKVRSRLRTLSQEDRWRDSIVRRDYGWRCTEEVLTFLKTEDLKIQRLVTGQQSLRTNALAHTSDKKFVVSLDECAIRVSKSIQEIRFILNSQDFLKRLGDPLQEHTSSRRLRGSTQITDRALASLEYTCRNKSFPAPVVHTSHLPISTPASGTAHSVHQGSLKKEQDELLKWKDIEDRFPFTLGDCAYSLSVDITWVFNALKNPKFSESLGTPLEWHLSSKAISSNTGITLKASQCLADIFNSLDQNSKSVHKISRKPGRKPHLVAPRIATKGPSPILSNSLSNRVLSKFLLAGPLIAVLTFVLASLQLPNKSGLWTAGAFLAAFVVAGLFTTLFLFRSFYVKNWRISQTLPRKIVGLLLLFARISAGICIALFNAADLLRNSPIKNIFGVFYEFQELNKYYKYHVAESSLIGVAILTLFDLALFWYLYRGRIRIS